MKLLSTLIIVVTVAALVVAAYGVKTDATLGQKSSASVSMLGLLVTK